MNNRRFSPGHSEPGGGYLIFVTVLTHFCRNLPLE